VLRHITPDMLAQYLPRPLWARLLTACLGAPRVDAQLVVETIGVPNLCEHLPGPVIWQVIAEIAARVLGQPYVAPAPGPAIVTRSAAPIAIPVSKSAPIERPIEGRSVLAPPPDAIEAPVSSSSSSSSGASVGPSIPAPVNGPLADLITELEADERPITPTRARTPTSHRFRQSNTGIGRLGASPSQPPPQARRPQAAVPMPPSAAPKAARRGATEVEEVETDMHAERASQREIAVDDSQLVDWQSTETTQAAASGDEDFSDIGRKR